MGASLKGKNLLPEGANSFLYEKSLMVLKTLFPNLVIFLECVQFSLRTYVNRIMGARHIIYGLLFYKIK